LAIGRLLSYARAAIARPRVDAGAERSFSSSLKRPIASSSWRDIFDICSELAASSVELDVDC